MRSLSPNFYTERGLHPLCGHFLYSVGIDGLVVGRRRIVSAEQDMRPEKSAPAS
jgi:hypothetical protein